MSLSKSWLADSDAAEALGFALKELRGSLRVMPATEAVFSKGFL
jgi:hypothetical protein